MNWRETQEQGQIALVLCFIFSKNCNGPAALRITFFDSICYCIYVHQCETSHKKYTHTTAFNSCAKPDQNILVEVCVAVYILICLLRTTRRPRDPFESYAQQQQHINFMTVFLLFLSWCFLLFLDRSQKHLPKKNQPEKNFNYESIRKKNWIRFVWKRL